MSLARRSFVISSLLMPLVTWADAYPSKPIEWVVPYAAGGGTDVVARVLSEPMGKALGQSIIVVNKPGAATNIGADAVARAKPDGYTILTGDTGTLAANPYLYKKLSYSAEKDFAPVGLLVRFPMLLVVNSQLPVNNYAEFVEWAKQQTKGVSYGTPGAGSPHHLAIELLRSQSGLNFVHIPYRGSAPAVQDVVAGQLPFMFVDTAAGIQHVQGGKIRAIAVASPARLPTLPDVPTLDEQGLKGFEAYAWQGIVAPAATPKERVAKLSDALQSALKQADIVAKLEGMALEVTPSTAEEMDAYASAERNKWRRVIEESQITLD
ncbi:Bug family tripartite tricarboxylate transporter substrate binding protein [Comamonas kerstersii]|uniref:ABC transporter substrate-binding protein n=1 Tax=Comamonas kerstersii TaxID=225992 RepID=A0A0W7YUY0_9BURK|nr:tripartite tricarboxylate transporter substrate binding protein [Comamonas kerstersii]KUF38864.1 ABC transporter substrate-binding protein [Comamonas kerstersii]OOH85238.1 ABC transporter substrate-binding protein [Comamonas kerstersii]OOH92635.1 ABC transporter substrate-binding protein [Comamonas kerstersii]